MDDGPAPPAVGVNVNVAETPDLPETRSASATANATEPTAPPMAPDAISTEAIASVLVRIATAIELGVASPIVNPLMVTANASAALMVAPEVVKTTDVMVVVELVMPNPGTLLASAVTTGVTNRAKKLGGYVRVMVPPGGML